MRYSTFLFKCALLFTLPSLLFHPEAEAAAKIKTSPEQSLSIPKDRLLYFDEIMDILDKIESGELEQKCTARQLQQINEFLVLLAEEGVLPNQPEVESLLAYDIHDLLEDDYSPYEYSFSLNPDSDFTIMPALCYDPLEVVLCKNWLKKSWKKTRRFVRRHKKEIIIGAAIVVAVTVIVVAIAIVSSASATAAVGAVGAAAGGVGSSSEETHEDETEPHSDPFVHSAPLPHEKPPSTSTEDSPAPSSLFSDIFTENKPVFLAAKESLNINPEVKEVFEEQISTFKETILEKERQEPSNPIPKPLFKEVAKDLMSVIAHEGIDALSEITWAAAEFCHEVRNITDPFLPEKEFSPDSPLAMTDPLENHEHWSMFLHEKVDEALGTHQASGHTAEARAARNKRLVTGFIPLPATVFRGINASKFKEVLKAGQKVTVLSEEAALTAREIVEIEKAGVLDTKISTAAKNLFQEKTMIESLNRFNYAQKLLKPYAGKNIAEIEAKKLIHQLGIKTFPRPEGIPINYKVQISDRGVGIKYIHPTNNHISVRVMPGKPHSPFPHQQKPYVVVVSHGKTLDKYGNIVDPKSPTAHIPLDEFQYKKN